MTDLLCTVIVIPRSVLLPVSAFLVLLFNTYYFSPEKLIVCITQTGPSLPYHCYWGEEIQMHSLSLLLTPPPHPSFFPSFSLYHHTEGIRGWGLSSKESDCVAHKMWRETRTCIKIHRDSSVATVFVFGFKMQLFCNGNRLCWQSFKSSVFVLLLFLHGCQHYW